MCRYIEDLGSARLVSTLIKPPFCMNMRTEGTLVFFLSLSAFPSVCVIIFCSHHVFFFSPFLLYTRYRERRRSSKASEAASRQDDKDLLTTVYLIRLDKI